MFVIDHQNMSLAAAIAVLATVKDKLLSTYFATTSCIFSESGIKTLQNSVVKLYKQKIHNLEWPGTVFFQRKTSKLAVRETNWVCACMHVFSPESSLHLVRRLTHRMGCFPRHSLGPPTVKLRTLKRQIFGEFYTGMTLVQVTDVFMSKHFMLRNTFFI